jgi:membrane protein insertase Oxa1/YidC/SpoIIIJ
MVFLVSSVLVTVPSGACLMVVSFDLTVPSRLTLLLSVLETSRSHPTSRNDKAKADVARQITVIRFFIMLFLHFLFSNRVSSVVVYWLIGEAVSS